MNIIQTFYSEVIIAAVIYVAGLLTLKLWQKLTRKRQENALKQNVNVALEIIFESEKKFPGRKRGVEKLEYAVKKFMDETKFSDYEKAQNYIIQIFNLTKLSKVDFPQKKKPGVVRNT